MRGRLARRRREEGAGGRWQGRAEPPLARPMCEAAAAAGSRRRHFGCGGQCWAASACRDSVATQGPGREGGRGGGRWRSREPPRRASRPHRPRLRERPGGTRGPDSGAPLQRSPAPCSRSRGGAAAAPRGGRAGGRAATAWGARPELTGTALRRFGRRKRPKGEPLLRASRSAPQVWQPGGRFLLLALAAKDRGLQKPAPPLSVVAAALPLLAVFQTARLTAQTCLCRNTSGSPTFSACDVRCTAAVVKNKQTKTHRV